MKRLLFFFLLLSGLTSQAQRDFEGWIFYKTSPEDHTYIDRLEKNGDSMDIQIGFTERKILIRNNTKSRHEDLLILLDSAKSYNLDHKNKTYSIRKLKVVNPFSPATVMNIAGYRCTPIQSNGPESGWGSSLQTTIWTADSLYFHIPEKFKANEELLMVRNDHIMLRAEISLDYNEDYSRQRDVDSVDEKNNKVITIQATSIIPGNIKPDDFLIPAEYTFDNLEVRVDTVVSWDTAYIPDPPAPAPKKAPATPKKPASKAKPTTKPPIRKEN